MEALILVSNLLLVLFTGIYVFLTYMLLRQTVAANKTSQDAIEKQFRIQTSPSVYCSVVRNEGEIVITVYNLGTTPLYDVDVKYAALYSIEDIDVPTFLVEYVESKYRNQPLSANNEGFFGVSGFAMYPVFPQSRKVSFSSKAPPTSDFIYVLLQLRDMLGINYSQLYSFGYDDESNTYRLTVMEPNVATPSLRVVVEHKRGKGKFKTLTGEPLPPYIASASFTPIFLNGISEGYLEGPFVYWEDRGTWTNL